MSIEYSFWSDDTYAVYGVQATGRTLIGEFIRTLRAQGKTVHLVDPRGGEFRGEPVATSLKDLAPGIESVLLVIEPDRARAAIEECREAGVRRVWIDTRGDSSKAADAARTAGMEVVVERCPLLTMPGAMFLHKAHAGLLRLFGRLPKP